MTDHQLAVSPTDAEAADVSACKAPCSDTPPPAEFPSLSSRVDGVAVLRKLSWAPPDAPRVLVARHGLRVGLLELAQHLGEVAGLAAAIDQIDDSVLVKMQAPGTPPTALLGRTQLHYVWAALLYVGAATPNEDTALLACLLAAELVQAHVRGVEPSSAFVARIAAAIASPSGATARGWGAASRERHLASRIVRLRASLAAAPARAAALGIAVPALLEAVRSPNQKLNLALARHFANRRDLAKTQARRGVSGHGAADHVGLRSIGRTLRALAEAGDDTALADVVAIITGLTADLVQAIPLRDVPDANGVQPAIWVDLDQACVWSIAALSDRQRARPERGTIEAYLSVADRVRVPLPSWCVTALAARCGKASAPTLLGEVLHGHGSGRKSLDGGDGAGYRVSIARLRRQLMHELLERGEPRFVLAVALHAPELVSVGRLSYGAIRQPAIDRVVAAAFANLGWGALAATDQSAPPVWVGASVVPLDTTLVRIARAQLADIASEDDQTLAGLTRRHAAVAAAVAFRVALLLALRTRDEYPVTRADLAAEASYVGDKAVPHGLGAGVPIVPALREVADCWHAWIERFQGLLASYGDPAAQAIASAIDIWRQSADSPAIWVIDSAGRLVPAGSATWRSRLPRHMRVVGNVGRHWWTTRLTDLGVPQVLQDALLRHEAPGLGAGLSASPWSTYQIRDQLALAMEQCLADLNLPSLRGLL